MTTHSQRALILYRRRRFINHFLLTYLHCVPKKQYTKLIAITLSILNRFSKFIHCWKEKLIFHKPIEYFPPYLQYIAALPREIQKFEFWHIWKKMQTRMKHALIFEHTPNLKHLAYLLTCCFNFRFLLNIVYKQQTILYKQVL